MSDFDANSTTLKSNNISDNNKITVNKIFLSDESLPNLGNQLINRETWPNQWKFNVITQVFKLKTIVRYKSRGYPAF